MSSLPAPQVLAGSPGTRQYRVSQHGPLAGTRRDHAAQPVGVGHIHPFDGGFRNLRPAQSVRPPRRKLGVTRESESEGASE